MNWASGEIVSVLTFLLPGFVAAGIFHSLTSHPKPGAFERIVLALIFTVIAQTVTDVIALTADSGKAEARSFRDWMPALSISVAIALGAGAVYFSNTDAVHRILRRLRITKETSFPSEWHSTFARYSDRSFVVLHLQSKDRLYGFAEEWPSDPKEGHFRISDAEWLDGLDGRIPAQGVDAILIRAAEVTMIEFLPIMTGRRPEEAI